MKRIIWKIGGEAGFGIMVSGLTFSKTISRAGYQIFETNDYPSLIRGGHNVVSVSICDQEIKAAYKPVDLLVALNKETVELHRNELSCHSVIIYDGKDYQLTKGDFIPDIKLCSVPLLSLAKGQGGNILTRNTVALGASMAVLGIDFKLLTSVIDDQFIKKGEAVVKQNISAAKVGFDYVRKNYPKLAFGLINKPAVSPQAVLTGCEAISLGAIAAGMKFFSAYPMTPINGIITYLASVSKKMGFIYKQPEDEIAAINMAIGASFTGVRSMVATSGGGFSLMVEGLGLAGMTETPLVIVMGMRPGPSTGLATWTGQGDLKFILNASQGEFPRLVLAPGDLQEAYNLTIEAFNLADRFQTPVFVLVDKFLCESRRTINEKELTDFPIKIDRGKLINKNSSISFEKNRYRRYELTDDGISPRAIPGLNLPFIANSYEHDEYGFSTEEEQMIKKMVEKRRKKQYGAAQLVPQPVVYGNPTAEVTLVGWGSTKGVVQEAIRQLGNKVNYLHLNYLNPFPSAAVGKILSQAKRVIDIEGNSTAQLALLIREKTGFEIKDKILKYNGRPFYPEDIIAEVNSLITI